MNTSNLHDSDFASWCSFFPGMDKTQLRTPYENWHKLMQHLQDLQAIVKRSNIDMSEVSRELEDASQKLDIDKPYRVVVLGETGAGKSTILNTLLGEDILARGAGGAVTGVATYIYPNPKQDHGQVKVFYGKEKELLESANRMISNSSNYLPSNLDEAANLARDSNKLKNEIYNVIGDENESEEIAKSVKDILETAMLLKEKNYFGKIDPYDRNKNRLEIQELMEEQSKRNLDPKKRVIPGIIKVEYYLDKLEPDNKTKALWSRVVIIDTPGIGARVLRHQHILQDEVSKADAVILVVKADRPEGQAAQMAKLLERVFFQGYSEEEKEKFADKVFFVVNQIDRIETDADQRRLENSVNDICRIIAHNYLNKYGPSSNNRRYFQTQADLAHQAIIESGLRSSESVANYQKSQIPALQEKLLEFVGKRRLELALSEAGNRINRAVSKIKQIYEHILRDHNLKNDQLHDIESIRLKRELELCEKQLDKDRKELLELFKVMHTDIDAWRTSVKHKEKITDKINIIYTKLHECIENGLNDIFNNSTSQPNGSNSSDSYIIGQAIDDVGSERYYEMHPRRLLLSLEIKLRRQAEEASKELADYYLDIFDGMIDTHNLYKRMQEKYYDQSYMKNSALIGDLKKQQNEIHSDFNSICCWVILFELIQRPILFEKFYIPFEADKKISIVLDVIRNIAPAYADMQSRTAGIWPLAARIVSYTLGLLLEPPEQNDSNIMSPANLINKFQSLLTQQSAFIKKISAELDISKDFSELHQLICDEFSNRYKSAFSISLPFMEDLFFYEFQKFRLKFESITEDLRVEHRSQIRSGTANSASIRQALIGQLDQRDKVDYDNIDKAFELMSSLNSLGWMASI